MKKYLILLIYFCFSCNNNSNEKTNTFQVQIGDLLFQDLDSDLLCDAIELVTPGYKNGNFSHIGIVIETNKNHVRVLEAIPNKVKTTRLDSFLNRSADSSDNPKVIVGRLKNEYQYSIPNAISFLKKQIGKEYDNVF